jgi:hypothetical protein
VRATLPAAFDVDEFKRETQRKLQDVRCPVHHQSPRLNFRGATLREVTVQIKTCCNELAALANRKIAGI